MSIMRAVHLVENQIFGINTTKHTVLALLLDEFLQVANVVMDTSFDFEQRRVPLHVTPESNLLTHGGREVYRDSSQIILVKRYIY